MSEQCFLRSRDGQHNIALLTQYNGHGIFIALEELGFVAMSVSLFCLAPSVNSEDRLGKIIRSLLRLPVVLMLLSFVAWVGLCQGTRVIHSPPLAGPLLPAFFWLSPLAASPSL